MQAQYSIRRLVALLQGAQTFFSAKKNASALINYNFSFNLTMITASVVD
jgi:hypothetical protein